jgi:uncharacterized phiE125 gp8 family phage protein
MLNVLKRGPDAEPVSVAELKAHLRVNESDDTLLRTLISSARMTVEAQAGLRLMTQSWLTLISDWPRGEVQLPHWPVQAISRIRLLGPQPALVDEAVYDTQLAARPARLFVDVTHAPRPLRTRHGIEIEQQVGYGDAPSDVPDNLRLAVLMLAGHWYDMDDFGQYRPENPMPKPVQQILAGERKIRL